MNGGQTALQAGVETRQTWDHRAESKKWLTRYFLRTMTALHVSQRDAPQLTPEELTTVKKSIQQFQLGEGSRGQRLLKRAQEYAELVDDPFFVPALDLFVKEEQQHSRYLADFLQSQGVPLLPKHWVDSVFRWLRGLSGLELSLSVLVTAELIALPYYRALRDATGSHTLKLICTRILEDESAHLKFQASMLARVGAGQPVLRQRLLTLLHNAFLLGTICVVWMDHRKVFNAGGYDFQRFKSETLRGFCEWEDSRRNFFVPAPIQNEITPTRLVQPRAKNDRDVSTVTEEKESRL
jgi:hypothetical protein